MQRLRRNHGGYCGETIDIASLLADCRSAAVAHGWAVEALPARPGLELLALCRPAEPVAPRPLNIYLSAGIHGDEPAGPLASRQLLADNQWSARAGLWFCPCLNPTGFTRNRRENAEGLDLNRQYLHPVAGETLAHMAWLQRQPRFDLCLCLHEDWEAHGFYVYELNLDQLPSLAERIVERVADVWPIDRSEVIEGRAARNGVIRPPADPRSRPEWPEAFYLVTQKTRLSYTLEAPSDFPMAVRVAALVKGARAALEVVQVALAAVS